MEIIDDPIIGFWLFIISKHFVCEFVLQTNYQAQNKGTYGHPAGLIHAAITITGTFVALILTPHSIGGETIVWILASEAIIHYHQDWAKIKLSNAIGIEVLSERFWRAFGADQYLHFLFYIFVYWYIF